MTDALPTVERIAEAWSGILGDDLNGALAGDRVRVMLRAVVDLAPSVDQAPPPVGVVRWTDAKIEELVRMKARGVKRSEIAAHFGATPKAIDLKHIRTKKDPVWAWLFDELAGQQSGSEVAESNIEEPPIDADQADHAPAQEIAAQADPVPVKLMPVAEDPEGEITWTDEVIDRLIVMRAEGAVYADIEAELKIPIHALAIRYAQAKTERRWQKRIAELEDGKRPKKRGRS